VELNIDRAGEVNLDPLFTNETRSATDTDVSKSFSTVINGNVSFDCCKSLSKRTIVIADELSSGVVFVIVVGEVVSSAEVFVVVVVVGKNRLFDGSKSLSTLPVVISWVIGYDLPSDVYLNVSVLAALKTTSSVGCSSLFTIPVVIAEVSVVISVLMVNRLASDIAGIVRPTSLVGCRSLSTIPVVMVDVSVVMTDVSVVMSVLMLNKLSSNLPVIVTVLAAVKSTSFFIVVNAPVLGIE
jgi:hypothetical protein